jgi:hypothetical protein
MGHPWMAQHVVSHGRRPLGRGGTRIDPTIPLQKCCHTWLVRGCTYVVLVRFVPLQGWLLIQISVTLSYMSDSLFTAPLVEMHIYYYDDG